MPTRSACRRDDPRGAIEPRRRRRFSREPLRDVSRCVVHERRGEHAARFPRFVRHRRKRARRHWRVSDDAHRSAILLTFSRRAVREEPSDGARNGPRTSPKREAQGLHVVLRDGKSIRALTGAPRTLGQGSPMRRSRSSRRAPEANADVQRRLKRSSQFCTPRGRCPVSFRFSPGYGRRDGQKHLPNEYTDDDLGPTRPRPKPTSPRRPRCAI